MVILLRVCRCYELCQGQCLVQYLEYNQYIVGVSVSPITRLAER